MNPVTTLDEAEMRGAHTLGTGRHHSNREAGIENPLFKPDQIGNDITGMIAEIAFAKVWNVYPDIGLGFRGDIPDCIVNGKRIDVKAVTQRHHKLIAPHFKQGDAVDIYVLAYVDGNTVEFLGWAWAHELIADETVTDLGYGPTYVLPQHKLHAFNNQPEGATP